MLSLRKSASIGINNRALDQFFEDAEHVEIFYDEEENKLGLKPLEEETDDSYTLSVTDSGGAVTPMSFLKGKQLVPDITTRYRPETQKINDSTELVVVDLDEEHSTYGEPASEDEEEQEE